MATKSIKAVLSLQDKNFSTSIKKASTGVNSFNKKIDSSGKKVDKFRQKSVTSFKSIARSAMKLGAAYVGLRTLSNGVSSSVDAAKNQIAVEKKLETVLKQRTKATDAQINSILKLTSEQQKLGIIGDEIQIAGAQQVATFVSNTKSVEDLIPAMNNLLAQQKGVNATQQDAVNIANMMGKVLNGQTGALTRVGISFTEAQEKVLKYGTESERSAMLAQVITDNVGEMNKSLASLDEGKIKNMKNAWGDYKEEMGKKILPLQSRFAGWFSSKIPGISSMVGGLIDTIISTGSKIGGAFDGIKGKMSDIFSKNKDTFLGIKGIAKDIGGVVIDFTTVFIDNIPLVTEGVAGVLEKAVGLYEFIKDNWKVFEPIILGVTGALVTYKVATMALTLKTKILEGVTKAQTASQAALNAVMNMSPIGIITLAVGALITAGVLLYRNWDTVKEKAQALWDKMSSAFGGIRDSIVGAFNTVGEKVGGFVDGVKEKLNGLKDFIRKIGISIASFFVDPLNEVIKGINNIEIKIPKWVPKYGGKKFGFDIPEIPLPEYALGTSYFKGGFARINERGGEIVSLPNGAKVIPADKSEKIINNSRNIGDVIININATNKSTGEIVNELIPQLKLALNNM